MRRLSMATAVVLLCGCSGGSGSQGGRGGTVGSSGGSSQASGGSAQASGGSAQASGGSAQASGGSTQASGGSTQANGGSTQVSGGSTQASGGAIGGKGGTLQGSGGAAGSSSGGRLGTGGTTSSVGGAGGSAAGGTQGTGGSGGGLSTSDPNVVAIIVDQGAARTAYVNGAFASVTLCEPGTSNCQTIDHLLIDTGSVGVRVLESAVTLKLPATAGSTGKSLAECTPFISGTSWGPVRTADVKIGGESASNLRVQLIGESTYALPSSCSGTPINDVDTLGSKGILGIGLYIEDCGTACTRQASNPGVYYECASTGGCTVASVPLASQLTNPIASFPVDNNGSFIQLPSIPTAGTPSVSGFLVFGIGTRANNGLGSAKVIPSDQSGFVTTNFPAEGTTYKSFLDSGSNGIFFLNSSLSKLALCSGNLGSFYCPSTNTAFTASIPSKDGSAAPISFSVANAAKLSAANNAFSNLAGPMPGYPTDPTMPGFDWGLSFYFGRSVFTAIETRSTPDGTGPYFAF
jgi:hypothetical protein